MNMMQKLVQARSASFKNEAFGEIEVLESEGKFYFPATEVAEKLGYTNPRKAIIDHCNGDGVTIRDVIDTLGRTQQKKYINEGNLYRLISKSKLPQAERFESWVFDEVLPSIRKHGAYMTTDTLEQALANPDFAIGLLERLKAEKEEKQRLQTRNAVLTQQVNELQPKASYYDMVLQNKSLLSVTQIAKDYGMSATTLNKKLHEWGVQYKQGGVWLLYSKYHDKGYTQTTTHVIDADNAKVNTKWTQKGRLFLYELLKQNGVLPIIERQELAS